MSEWRIKKLSLPEGLEDVVSIAGSVASGVTTFLEVVSSALNTLKVFAQGGVDIYSTLVNTFIDETQNFLNDIKYAGVYVLVDYPQNLNITDFNPAAPVNLAGTVLDSRNIKLVTTDEDPIIQNVEGNTLQAISRRRKKWNPVSRDIISYREAIERIIGAFNDIEDPLRPVFSNDANTIGVVLMVYSENIATFLRLVRTITNLFAVDSLNQILWPGFEELFEDISKSIDKLSEQELEGLDLTPVFREGGRHPNFVMNARLGDLIPGLGGVLDALSELIEQFRPNGSISDFIQDILDALEQKIERINQIIFELESLASELKAAFTKESFATVVIESNTGNNGFKNGLRNSTKHPEFNRALVCSVVLYAGGPSVEPLKALFSSLGEAIPNSLQQSLAQAQKNIAKPVLIP